MLPLVFKSVGTKLPAPLILADLGFLGAIKTTNYNNPKVLTRRLMQIYLFAIDKYYFPNLFKISIFEANKQKLGNINMFQCTEWVCYLHFCGSFCNLYACLAHWRTNV